MKNHIKIIYNIFLESTLPGKIRKVSLHDKFGPIIEVGMAGVKYNRVDVDDALNTLEGVIAPQPDLS
jgi:hypothetical protein